MKLIRELVDALKIKEPGDTIVYLATCGLDGKPNLSACSRGLLSMTETSEGVFVPWLDRPDECTGCGSCEASCPWLAICLTGYVEDARRRLLTNRPGSVPQRLLLPASPGPDL
jgi:ferredoxin